MTPLHHGVTANHHHTHNNCSNSNRRRLEHTPSAISSEDSWCSERAASENDSSEGEDESDRSVSSTNCRNSQLRSTLNKAKHHLSFDKWRSGGGGSTNSSHSSSASGTLPPHHDTTSPGESPGGRLSRWFSIRRGSVHHYDIGSGKESRGSSVETDDNKPPPAPSSQTSKSSGGNKMPQLSEVCMNVAMCVKSDWLKCFIVSRMCYRLKKIPILSPLDWSAAHLAAEPQTAQYCYAVYVIMVDRLHRHYHRRQQVCPNNNLNGDILLRLLFTVRTLMLPHFNV